MISVTLGVTSPVAAVGGLPLALRRAASAIAYRAWVQAMRVAEIQNSARILAAGDGGRRNCERIASRASRRPLRGGLRPVLTDSRLNELARWWGCGRKGSLSTGFRPH